MIVRIILFSSIMFTVQSVKVIVIYYNEQICLDTFERNVMSPHRGLSLEAAS